MLFFQKLNSHSFFPENQISLVNEGAKKWLSSYFDGDYEVFWLKNSILVTFSSSHYL